MASTAPDIGSLGASLQFATWAAGAVPIAFTVHMFLFRGSGNSHGGLGLFFTIVLAAATFLWLGVLSQIVPEPYLDEVFHIPQAQRYCQGKFLEWDDKITTPPGLYWVSILIPQAAKTSGLISSYTCDPKALRATNAVGILVLAYLALQCRKEIEARLLHQAHSAVRMNGISQYAMHTAFNIALFPLLFFFSGLYYTDVVSTAVVLAAFVNHLRRVGRSHGSLVSDLVTVAWGLFALTMRQTNVFWVVVFMGGLEAVHAVKTLRPKFEKRPLMTTLSEQLLFVVKRWSVGHVHDLPLHMAYPEDMLFTAISLIVAALCNPLRVVRQIWPYVFVLGAFGGFVVWNGGVVLGDKSNHVATIHLPQMLYIWAFFAFFSLPLFLPYAIMILDIIRSLFVLQKDGAETSPHKTSAAPSTNTAPQREISLPLKIVATVFNNHLLWPVYLVSTFILSGLIVRFNTIIHPFTLADNRHYMFYIFRYTIRRAPWVRYLLILPYTLSRWLVWGTLSGCATWTLTSRSEACSSYYDSSRPLPFDCDPFAIGNANEPEGKQSSGSESRTQNKLEKECAQDPLLLCTEPVSTSTGLIFLLSTTLSLITAPLVEPRYFIIPWVIWRLLVPAWRLHDHQAMGNTLFSTDPTSTWGKIINFCRVYDVRLVLETVWFVAINLITGYLFLFKPYVWRAEDGSVLDEGRLQRFMW
ncbi:GT59 alpha-1,2 glucosyltransferase [Trichoderma parareesei]|uniref:Dol-P-Glc:Glc(2)Man(9)GlcNAc(2)-PP-Dol alpha-1,2-glucosyltransferase n=1 Tax=Trichoderma parareesei TaxID=858221 RepID=A0A2H2ZYX9_TRIPA|nr:GT59 alpha-1,2 glucosyltransferase [Trichoderma parareesei]